MITDWSKFSQPMLLGSVAIGGITQVGLCRMQCITLTLQVLPFLYRSFYTELDEGISQRKKTILFIGSIVLGLTICAIFNIYWVSDL